MSELRRSVSGVSEVGAGERREVRRAALATALLFIANGAVFSAIVPRLPDLKDSLELGPAAFGLAMACYPAGALVGGLLTPALMRRRSDGAVAVGTMISTSAVAALLGFSPVVAVFAGLGFIAVQGAQLIGRFSGDSLVERFSAARVGRMGGLCVMLGAGVALVASFLLDGPLLIVVLLAGFAAAGWGIATVIPGAMVGADSVPGLVPGAGLAILNWVMRVGFLVSPPVVGFLAEQAGMRWVVAPMILGGLCIAVLAGPLLGRGAGPEEAARERAREGAGT